jgi:diaminopimelate epimerase
MEPELQFVKYTSFGNTFIIVDETRTPLADDAQRAAFARWALNGDFGIGGTDNVLYLQRSSTLQRSSQRAADGESHYVFRIFEIDGSETLSCGNGLLSTAAALHRAHGGRQWQVLTEIPTGRPRPVQIGADPDTGETWVNVGWPRAAPAELINRPEPAPASGIDEIGNLVVPETVRLSGYLVFTGEPHLVLISGHGLPSSIEDRLFIDAEGAIGRPDNAEMRATKELVHHIGSYVNATYRHLFPQGVHLNFARIRGGLIEYRTWERAINCETLACGSGAVAMAYVGQRLGLIPRATTTFWPHRCRWYQPDASLSVTETRSGFVLTGQPRLVCRGVVPLSPLESAHRTVGNYLPKDLADALYTATG